MCCDKPELFGRENVCRDDAEDRARSAAIHERVAAESGRPDQLVREVRIVPLVKLTLVDRRQNRHQQREEALRRERRGALRECLHPSVFSDRRRRPDRQVQIRRFQLAHCAKQCIDRSRVNRRVGVVDGVESRGCMHARIASAIPLPDRPDARVVLFHILEALRRLATAKKWHTCDSDWHISRTRRTVQVGAWCFVLGGAGASVLREIDRHDVVAETRAKLRNWNVLRIGLVSVERRPVAEFDHERRCRTTAASGRRRRRPSA